MSTYGHIESQQRIITCNTYRTWRNNTQATQLRIQVKDQFFFSTIQLPNYKMMLCQTSYSPHDTDNAEFITCTPFEHRPYDNAHMKRNLQYYGQLTTFTPTVQTTSPERYIKGGIQQWHRTTTRLGKKYRKHPPRTDRINRAKQLQYL